ncbi:winged helix-turn-helix transcriptional regulator [Sphingomonas bacterium]|uniref:winged helix-turn-helix transcriptional regulator n=1 Tax=Sphingomonas bacterium TaxID=1895847 RepID=UPI0015766D57|nr:helix-turn-helix domain-containing protein [Sphingomonas bacterium]
MSKPVEKRWYDDACGTALALELVGERWSLLIVRELMFGPRRFGELRAGLPGISANVLTQRLEGMERAGILERRKLPPPASVQVYALTDWGRESEAAMAALGRWAVRSPLHDPRLPLSGASLMMSFRTMLDPTRTRGIDARIGFRIGPDPFAAHLHDGALDVVRAEADDAALRFATEEAGTIAAAVYGGVPLADLEAGGALRIEGDRALAERFMTLFPLPPKIA